MSAEKTRCPRCGSVGTSKVSEVFSFDGLRSIGIWAVECNTVDGCGHIVGGAKSKDDAWAKWARADPVTWARLKDEGTS